MTCALVVFGLVALIPALSSVYFDTLALPLATPFIAAYWLGAYATRGRLALGLSVGAGLQLAATASQADSGGSGRALTVGSLLLAPALIGRLLRRRAMLNHALREKAELLERHRADAAGRAVLDERTRIAGELHDVVAHALSAMTVQATGARRLTLTRTELARDAFGAIETAGREALDELRRLLGVLRREDAELTLAPQPSLRHVGSLVRRTSAAGLPTALRVDGEPRELPAGLDVTAYRVIGDALTAAVDVGGAGRADVRLRYRADALELEVRDDGPAAAARALIGIRERVLLHGGQLTAGPRRAGGYSVRATLPLDGGAVAEPECVAERVRAITAAPRLRFVRWLRTRFVTARDRPSRSARAARRRAAADGLAAAVIAVAAVAEVLASGEREGPLAANVALAVAYALPFAWRRRAPLAALIATFAVVLAMTLTLTTVEHLFVPFAVVLACTYSCAAHRDGRVAYAGELIVVAGLLAVVATFGDSLFLDFFFPALLGTFAWLAGRVVRSYTRLTGELHEAAARLAEAGEDERRLAAIDERRRIARELHDLVAHSISVMVVQAGGARRILDRDPGRALEAATRIERTGREALTEMRHLLGMLSDGAEAPALAPQPTLSEIGELVARARSAGLPTALAIRGEQRPLPAGLDLAAYRIVQEALTNAIKHAPGAPTTVTVRWGEDLALEIRDAGPGRAPDGAGHGLVGMRERVRLYGGHFEAGPTDTGWRVRATFPADVRELSLL